MTTLPDHRLETFRSRIQSHSAEDSAGCWIWQRSIGHNGYGKIGVGGGKTEGAHRASYMAFRGEVPTGMDVCHSCDVRACVNPAHLFLGTRSENLQDASRKGRMATEPRLRGAEHHSAKLNDASVPIILARLRAGEPKARIARDFNVSDRTILLIGRNQTWTHIRRSA